MNHLRHQYLVWLCILLACVGFILAGAALLPYNGVEEDEALFAAPVFSQVAQAYRIRVFHHNFPIMLMDYVGALKSWLYWPIFHVFAPSPRSLRFPVLIIAAIAIFLFARLVERVAGLRAALAAVLLLASDPIYLLTSEFDWGPVAMQHLMLVAACLFLLEFSRSGSSQLLAAGFFTLGLGMWDKAIFSWLIGGLVVASLATFPKEIFRRLTKRNLAIALASFVLGALPLLIFNVRFNFRTFRGNASSSTENFNAKVAVLRSSLNGQGLFGYMACYREQAQTVNEPETRVERASIRIADLAGEPHYNFQIPALGIALVAGLLFRKSRRPTIFALAFMATAWTLMAFTKNAGGASHHVVLLWPFPQFVVAVVLAEIARRWARIGVALSVAALALLAIANALVINQYLSQFVRYGPAVTWSDAIYPLSNSLRNETGDVFVVDWDIYASLILLNQGQLKLHPGLDLGQQSSETIDRALALPREIYLTHTPDIQFFPKANQQIESAAAARGYRKELLRVVRDSHGRPIFQVFQFVRQLAPR